MAVGLSMVIGGAVASKTNEGTSNEATAAALFTTGIVGTVAGIVLMIVGGSFRKASIAE